VYDWTFYLTVCCWCISGCAEARFGKFVCSFEFEEINFVAEIGCFARRDPNTQEIALARVDLGPFFRASLLYKGGYDEDTRFKQ
jgi:hypothetical protein